MEIHYQKDLEHCYLRILAEEDVDMESYQLRILIGNEVHGLLPCRIENVDGQREFCYEVSSEQTVRAVFLQKKLKVEQLKLLLQGFINALTDIQSFLLDVNQLILQTDYMYYDSERTMLRFCYFPEYNRELQTQFRSFLEELLSVIDHQDSKAVVMAYGIYHKCMEEGFNLEIIREYLYRSEKENDTKATEPSDKKQLLADEEQKEIESFAAEEKGISEKDSKLPWRVLITSAFGAAGLLGIGTLRLLGYLSVFSFSVIFGVFLSGLGIMGLSCYFSARKRGKEESAGWMPNCTEDTSIPWPVQEVKEQNIEKWEGRLVSQNPGQTPDIVLKEASVLIGKMEGAVDVVIPKSTISRVHARFRREKDACFLVDLNSTNGTYVNGKRIWGSENHPIIPGDEIRFADVAYVYRQ